MSQNIASVAAQMWDPLFETQLQNVEYLQNTVRVFPGVVGDVYNRRLGSFGEMMPLGYNASNIPVSQINYSQTPISLYPYAYKTAVSQREMTLVDGVPAQNIMQEEAITHARALGRYMDYLKLNAVLSNVSPYVTIPKTIGYGTGLNSGKIIEARAQLQLAAVDSPEIYYAVSADLTPALAADQFYSSWFFNEARPLTQQSDIPRQVLRYYGVEGRILGGVGINSLPYTISGSNKTYTCPFWSKDVITMAMATMIPKTTICFNQFESRYEIITEAVLGVGVTQVNGVVLIAADTANTAN